MFVRVFLLHACLAHIVIFMIKFSIYIYVRVYIQRFNVSLNVSSVEVCEDPHCHLVLHFPLLGWQALEQRLSKPVSQV